MRVRLGSRKSVVVPRGVEVDVDVGVAVETSVPVSVDPVSSHATSSPVQDSALGPGLESGEDTDQTQSRGTSAVDALETISPVGVVDRNTCSKSGARSSCGASATRTSRRTP